MHALSPYVLVMYVWGAGWWLAFAYESCMHEKKGLAVNVRCDASEGGVESCPAVVTLYVCMSRRCIGLSDGLVLYVFTK